MKKRPEARIIAQPLARNPGSSAPRSEEAPPEPAERVVQRVLARGGGATQLQRDALVLQQTIGNRATARLLSGELPAPHEVRSVAAAGLEGVEGRLPHLDRIRASFGQHDVSGVRAHTGNRAQAASRAIGAAAYTTGDRVAFADPHPDLHTAAHEAAHVVQQRGGLQLASGVGREGDVYERQADEVAERVIEGRSAEGLLDRFAGGRDGRALQGPLVQRRDMRAVMIDQRAREKEVDEKKKSEAPGRFTTVGFEWDVAVTAPHREEAPNVLQGLTHVELAESDLKWNKLPYMFETDAGNVLEFVTPPFYVATRAPGSSLPDPADLDDIIDSTRAALTNLVVANETLDQLLAKSWASVAIGAWAKRELAIAWRNWSQRAQGKAKIEEGLAGWGNITISEVTTARPPQINIAVTARDYSQAIEAGGSRLGAKDEFVKLFNDTSKKLENYVALPARTELKSKNSTTAERINLVLDQLIRVLAQQLVVPHIRNLAETQERGYDKGEDVTNAMRRQSGSPSYIKDAGIVWLKTDLFSYAAGVLKGGDWALLGGDRGLLATMIKALGKAQLGKSVDKKPMEGVLTGLKGHTDALAAVKGETEKEKVKPRQEYISEVFKKIGDALPGFNEHDPRILGVRQDTFINPTLMVALSSRLNLKALLQVMEVRNTEDFLKWLRTGEKSKGVSDQSGSVGSGGEEELVAAPTINVNGGVLRANVTAGDGNCFFHSLHESRNHTRSSVPLQLAQRQAVLDALAGNAPIARSHFGPQGVNSPEYIYFAANMLAEGAWVTDQTPAIVSDALNLRIVIHRVDGSVYYDARPNGAFHHGAVPMEVHVQYTGNHYNSYTPVAL